jgi:hypothetical protein
MFSTRKELSADGSSVWLFLVYKMAVPRVSYTWILAQYSALGRLYYRWQKWHPWHLQRVRHHSLSDLNQSSSSAYQSGGQYHWVSEFSPRSCQRFLSYLVGWFCVLDWQTGSAASAFLAGTELQVLILLNHQDDYVFQARHGTLLVIAIATFCGVFNTLLARKLPLVEGTVLLLHVLGFFAIIIPLWILAPRSSAKEVFTTFNKGDWSSTGLSCLVGILAPTVSLLGSDAATHMSEVSGTKRERSTITDRYFTGAARRLLYPSKGNDCDSIVQWNARIFHGHHVLFLSRRLGSGNFVSSGGTM